VKGEQTSQGRSTTQSSRPKKRISKRDLKLMRAIDEQYLKTHYYGRVKANIKWPMRCPKNG